MNECGLPKGISDIILKATRSSTQSLYDKRWSAFEKWCTGNNIVPLTATVSEILQYLDFLRSDLHLVPGTIAGHKTTIVVTLESSVNRIQKNDLHIKMYIKGLMTTAKPNTTLPDWDLSLVLKA